MTTEQELLKQQLEQQEAHNRAMKRNMLSLRIFLTCIAVLFFLPMTGWFTSNGGSPAEDDYIYEETFDIYYEEYYY